MQTDLVSQVESFLGDYVVYGNPKYALPMALWAIGTYCYDAFDAYPYVIITSPTKRSGKTRLLEILSFVCANPERMASLTGPTFFRLVESGHPTIFYDEAEKLNSEAASTEREVINVGYRRGTTIARSFGSEEVKRYETYCPKVFALIGNTYDTLHDRSLIVTMYRAEPAKRFTFREVQNIGQALRVLLEKLITKYRSKIERGFAEHKGLPWLQDRDEEIWTSLFVLCEVFCPDRLTELQAAAADMAAEKTAPRSKFSDTELKEQERAATELEYGKRCLLDLWSVFLVHGGKYLRTEEAVELLRAMPTGPWRKYRGNGGLTDRDLALLIDRFKCGPCRIALGSGRGKQKFYRGYKRAEVESAIQKL